MGYIHLIKKDKNVRVNFKKNELESIITKYNLANSNISKIKKYYIFFNFINKFHLSSSYARIVNRCAYVGRSRWVLRRFRMTRMVFKSNVDLGLVTGLRRAS